jgi:hypothetical protein
MVLQVSDSSKISSLSVSEQTPPPSKKNKKNNNKLVSKRQTQCKPTFLSAMVEKS